MEFSKRERERMEMSSKVREDEEDEVDRKWWGKGSMPSFWVLSRV